MHLARTTPVAIDLDAELLAAYPALVRRLTLVLRDAGEGEDVAQAAFARALEHRRSFRGGDARVGTTGRPDRPDPGLRGARRRRLLRVCGHRQRRRGHREFYLWGPWP